MWNFVKTNLMKNLKENYSEGINGILFITYCIFIFSADAYVLKSNNLIFFLRTVFFIVIGSIMICPFLMKFVRKISIQSEKVINKENSKIKWRIMFFVIPLSVFLFYYMAYFPGGFSPDSIVQYTQAINNEYNDWHPVIQTLLAIKLPLMITGGWIGSITLFQIIVFSSVLSYSLYSLMIWTNRRFTIAAMLFILLNPQMGNIAMFPWKDVSFAIGALLLLTYAMHVYFSDGKWMQKKMNMVLFIVVEVLTTLFRHNALLFTIPLAVAVFCFISRKRMVVIVMGILILGISIKIPLYTMLNVEQPDKRQVETLGLPMNIIGAVAAKNPEALDIETKEFVYKVAQKNVWETKYSYGNYNSVKWDQLTNNDVIEEYGALKVLSMMFRCLKNSPREAIMGLIKLTNVVYSVSDDFLCYTIPSISSNDYNIKVSGIPVLQMIDRLYAGFCNVLLPHLFMYTGSMHFILLLSILSKCKLNRWMDWKKILFIIPVLLYNFGTMFLLTGADDSGRFFYYTFLLMPVLIAFLYKEKRSETVTVTV